MGRLSSFGHELAVGMGREIFGRAGASRRLSGDTFRSADSHSACGGEAARPIVAGGAAVAGAGPPAVERTVGRADVGPGSGVASVGRVAPGIAAEGGADDHHYQTAHSPMLPLSERST